MAKRIIKEVSAAKMAAMLQEKGFKISLIFRKEGGARITKINGERFQGSKGNIKARELLGLQFTEARQKQLKGIKQQKGVFGNRKEKLPEEFLKLQNEANRAFKKGKNTAKVTRKKIRYRLENDGYTDTLNYLKNAVRYAKGFAFDENLQIYYLRMQGNVAKGGSRVLDLLMQRLEKLLKSGASLRREDFQELLDLTYEWEKLRGTPIAMSDTSFVKSALAILKKAEEV